MKKLKRIKLILSSNILTNEDLSNLMESIKNKPLELFHLDINSNCIEDQGIENLCKTIENFTEL